MDQPRPTQHPERGALARLRALSPRRELTVREALHIAELQATQLLGLTNITEPAVPSEIVTDFPHLRVECDPTLPGHAASGCSDWDASTGSWVISLNPDEPAVRQRFTLLHELKHIVDHGSPGVFDRSPSTTRPLAESVADFFAACALMPRAWVKQAYFDGIQRPDDLADLFDVSVTAMQVRLRQLGLSSVDDASHPDTRQLRMQPAGRRRLSLRGVSSSGVRS